jgi:hypothetical protein
MPQNTTRRMLRIPQVLSQKDNDNIDALVWQRQNIWINADQIKHIEIGEQEHGWFGHYIVIHMVTGERHKLGGSHEECYSEEQARHIVETLLEEIA